MILTIWCIFCSDICMAPEASVTTTNDTGRVHVRGNGIPLPSTWYIPYTITSYLIYSLYHYQVLDILPVLLPCSWYNSCIIGNVVCRSVLLRIQLTRLDSLFIIVLLFKVRISKKGVFFSFLLIRTLSDKNLQNLGFFILTFLGFFSMHFVTLRHSIWLKLSTHLIIFNISG